MSIRYTYKKDIDSFEMLSKIYKEGHMHYAYRKIVQLPVQTRFGFGIPFIMVHNNNSCICMSDVSAYMSFGAFYKIFDISLSRFREEDNKQ